MKVALIETKPSRTNFENEFDNAFEFDRVKDTDLGLIGADRALCLRLSDGKVMWEETLKAQIASPILVGDKIVALTNNGTYLVMLKTDPSKYTELAKARVKAQWCPSPAFVDGLLLIRMSSHVACYKLTLDQAAR